MEKKLYINHFLSDQSVADFINDTSISREDIQTIFHLDGVFYLYYWG